VIFMAGLTHSNDTTGKDKKANGFRHFFNSYMSGAALAPVLKNAYGTDRKAYHLTADYNWGYTTEKAVKKSTEAMGWETSTTCLTPLAQTTSRLHHAGSALGCRRSGSEPLRRQHGELAHQRRSVRPARQAWSTARTSRSSFRSTPPDGEGCGANVKGIFGSTNWHWSLQDEGSKAFVKSFGEKYGFPPSQAAHTCYVQTLLYADAVSVPARSTHVALSKPSKASSSTVWATARPVPRRRPPVLQGRSGREG
jgi:branched-chain amino acid transport system substrate-binding protein